MLFMADHMARKLGKYLRILGYDAAWLPDMRTHDLIRRANAENRIFLTRNRHILGQCPKPERMILLASPDPAEQLKEVILVLGLDVRGALFTRCVACNVPLEEAPDKKAVAGRVHPNVFARYDTFYSCPSCGAVFWRGSHTRNTMKKLGLEP